MPDLYERCLNRIRRTLAGCYYASLTYDGYFQRAADTSVAALTAHKPGSAGFPLSMRQLPDGSGLSIALYVAAEIDAQLARNFASWGERALHITDEFDENGVHRVEASCDTALSAQARFACPVNTIFMQSRAPGLVYREYLQRWVLGKQEGDGAYPIAVSAAPTKIVSQSDARQLTAGTKHPWCRVQGPEFFGILEHACQADSVRQGLGRLQSG